MSSASSTSGLAAAAAAPPLKTRNPLPLSAAQEQQVRELYYARVRGYCAAEIKRFAECATNRTVSATWACRAQRREMKTCMVAHATLAEQDAARAEWFARSDERRRERGEKEVKRREQERFHREWWGLKPLGDDGGGDEGEDGGIGTGGTRTEGRKKKEEEEEEGG
ncbi:MAG: hypothetical protein M1816_006656 [Peltula sp. TS41687]|nr:MAG: hypothetical protein M1816_006656 [Peltula sp. TS41687]